MAITIACALVGAGCGHHAKGTTTGPTTSGSTSSTAAGTTSSTPFVGATSPVSVAPSSSVSHLTAVQAAAHPGFDRVVFSFDGGPPGYAVSYTSGPIRQDASGQLVAVQGGAAIAVHLSEASGVDLSGGSARPTYSGPDRVQVGGESVVELVRTGDFEGVLSFAVGVKTKVPFHVFTLAGPPRIVIDVQAN